MEKNPLWKIYVPKASNDGVDFTLDYHRAWDACVREIAGGLTIDRSVTGQWVSRQDGLFIEKMIPVEIACTEEQIYKIVAFTMQHYDQLAISVAKLSDDFRIICKKDLEDKLI